MEGIVLLILIAGGLVLSAILGLVAFIRQLTGSVGGGDGTRVRELERRVRRLEERVGRLVREAGEWEEVAPEEEVRAAEPAEPPETVEEKEVVEEEEEVGAEVAPPSPPEIPPTLPEEPAAEEEPVWARFERTVGKQWIAWAGALVIFLAVGFFVKYAIDVGWLGPTARCALGLVAGIVMAVAGDLFVRREMRGLGQGLIGGGLAVMYFSIFAAFSFYDLIPQTVAFGAMVLVTAGGMTLAVLHDALVVAMLAVIGGLLTPVLCNTGANRRDTLFLYLTVLDLGVLGVALFRRWRALDVVAFVGTWVLFAGWYAEFYAPEALVATTVWLMVFFLIFLVLPFAYHLRMRQRVPLERFVMELVNAATVFGFAFAMFHPEHQHVLGFVVLGMAACYVALGQASRSLLGAARELFGFVALAMIFLTIAVPLHLGLNGTLIGWAAEALVLLYLGYRFGYMPVRFGAAGVLAVAVVRFLTVFWPLHEGAFVLFWNTRFGTAVCLPLAGAIFVLLHRRWRESRVLPDRVLQAVAGVVSCLLFLLILHGEVGQWLVAWEGADPAFDGEFYALFARSLIWVVGGAAMLAVGLGVRSEAVRWSGLLPLGVGVVYAFVLYGREIGELMLFLNLRFVAGLVAVMVMFGWSAAMWRWKDRTGEGEVVVREGTYWMGVLVLFVVLSLEVWQFATDAFVVDERSRWAGLMALSLTWGLYAIALLAVGFWRRVRPLRLVALGLFGVTGLKLVLVDMAGVEELYRIVSFLAIGVLMVGASYLYHKVEKRMSSAEEEGE